LLWMRSLKYIDPKMETNEPIHSLQMI
jgi:hypothetical protein